MHRSTSGSGRGPDATAFSSVPTASAGAPPTPYGSAGEDLELGADLGSEDGPEDLVEDLAEEPSDEEVGDDSGESAPFAILPAPLRRALEARGFLSFTPVQSAVLDAVGAGCDLRISSQTGSGKTVALGFAMAADVLAADGPPPADISPDLGRPYAVARPTRPQRGPVALVIVPTRELAAQVAEELTWLFAEVPGASVDVVTGGTSVPFERRRLARSPRILVGTPGRLLDHLESGALALDAVRQLVLDEADQMLDMGFRDELEAILERTPPERRTHLVSATFPEGIQRLAERYQKSPRSVEGSRLGAVNADIEHIAHLVRPEQRYDLLVNHLLLSGGERTLVFVNTRAETGELAARLTEDGFGAQPLSGELQQSQRTRTLAAFRAGTAPVLIATDVAARGLDVPDVALVVHTALPLDGETYIHRSGRTGRAGQRGRSVLMVSPSKERRAARMLTEVGLRVQWRPGPPAAEVQAALDARAAAALEARIAAAGTDEGAPTPRERALARELLAAHDAERIVAALLRDAVQQPPTAPRSLADLPDSRAFGDRRTSLRRGRDGYERGPYERGPQERFPERRGPRFGGERTFEAAHPAEGPERSREGFLRGDDRRSPRRPAEPQLEGRPEGRRGGDFVRFRVNWGFRGGANPRRLLATLCRRGGVTNREIGSIDIGPAESSFEVAAWAAEGFAARAAGDDPRDPGLWIGPDDAPRGRFRGGRRG